jgi:O-antigen ligase
MAAAAGALPATHTVARLRRLMLWLAGFAGGFVFVEPSPYEIVALATLVVFFVSGLPLRPGHLPLLFLLVLYNVGIAIALAPVLARDKALVWAAVSWFLTATALFYACALAEDTERRLKLLFAGYTAAAVIVAVIAVLGYFQLFPGADATLLYGRAKSTFNDPNVLGPFLVLPSLLALQRVLTGRSLDTIGSGALLALFAATLFLTFSRGAWAHFAISALLYATLLFYISKKAGERTRIVGASVAGALLLALLVGALLSLRGVESLFEQRASLEQSYDVGQLGRFGRHLAGALLALDRPLGIGPYEFARIFPEDPHNVYLNAFMTAGWLGGISYIALVATTLWIGFRAALVETPWRPMLLAAWATFAGVAFEGAIIDSDHWRHFWLLMGVLWAGAVAVRRPRVAPPSATAYSPAPGRSVAQPG